MDQLVLCNQTADGVALQATFAPNRGMNLMSYKWGDIELMAPSSKQRFEETGNGLGALIGPHYESRHPGILPKIESPSPWWPHISNLQSQGHQDPFYQGVGRYAPWEVQSDDTTIKAKLSGKQAWQGTPLSRLEGQNFVMELQADLTPTGLTIAVSVVSDSDSIVGLDYHFNLPEGTNSVSSDVRDYYLEDKSVRTIPADWRYSSSRRLTLDVNRPLNYTFYPYRKNPQEGQIWLDTSDYRLDIEYRCQSEENAWQVVHPQGADFVCIRPLSAKLPHRPSLTVSSLNVRLFPTPCKV